MDLIRYLNTVSNNEGMSNYTIIEVLKKFCAEIDQNLISSIHLNNVTPTTARFQVVLKNGTIYQSNVFDLPAGPQGPKGEKGDTGNTPDITIYVNSLPAGSTPTVIKSGTLDYPVYTIGIPKGDKGDKGDTGNTGATGNGIASITKTGTSGLVDTYTINYTDGTTSTFTITNGADGINGQDGNGIATITKTSTSGLVDTYTITFTNGTTTTFTVTNGEDGTDGTNGTDGVGIASIIKTGTSGLVDTYTITLTNGNTSTFTVTNALDDDFHSLSFKDEVKTPHTSSQNLSSLLGSAYVAGATYELYGYCSAYASDSRNASLYTDLWNTDHDVNINTLSNSRIQQWAFTIPAKTNITMVSNSTFSTFVFAIYGYRRIK